MKSSDYVGIVVTLVTVTLQYILLLNNFKEN